MILVTAANGNQGRLLVPKLLAAGHPVRGCVRTEDSAATLREHGVSDVVVGDLSDPAVAAAAVHGVTKIYHVGPTIHPRERDMGFTLIDTARTRKCCSCVVSRLGDPGGARRRGRPPIGLADRFARAGRGGVRPVR